VNLSALARELAPLLRGRVAVVTGAGVSAESGIPTFRGAGGYWRNHDPTQLATPEAFARDPALVWEWYGERRDAIRNASPNPGHRALARLGDIAREHLIVTQNVDDLHERAGTPPDHLVHIHGEIFRSACTSCAFATHDAVAPVPPPRCPRCAALLRPGVVWFGEMLDDRAIARVERFFDGGAGDVDVVLAIGTTALFRYIVDWATRTGRLVEVNPEPTPLSAHAAHVVRAPAGQALPVLLGLV
jgi:NAD-dependent deacetylase